MHRAKKEFSRFAYNYNSLNLIQKEVARYLISKIKPADSILDLGSGTGEVYKNIDFQFDRFVAVDISENMCLLHPKDSKIEVLNEDFEKTKAFDENFDLIISSSSLQWSKNLDDIFFKISKSSKNVAFAIFTSNTFKTLNQLANIESLIYSKEVLLEKLSKYYNFESEVKEYKLNFKDNLEMLRYIKKSGVSGGVKRLKFKDIKNLIDNYPLEFLEFEILYIFGKSK